MPTHAIAAPMTETSAGAGATKILEVLRRRRNLAVLPFVFVLAAALSLAYFLPNVWTARAVILVDPQQVPDSFVKPAVSGDRERQVLSLSQQIVSRPRLAEIATAHRLYGPRESPYSAAERMRRDIRIEAIGDDPTRRSPAGLVAFSVSYQATNPVLTTVVTNELARLFVEENERGRERQATTTSEFLDTQLVDLRTRLEAQERRIAEYKEHHLGELPEQRDANLRTVERLQQQLQFANENMRRANERKSVLARTLTEIDHGGGPGGASAPDINPAKLASARLNLLHQELASAEARLSPDDPRIARLREQIQKYESLSASAPRPTKTTASVPAQRRAAPDNPYVVSLMTQLDAANIEAKATQQDIAAINAQVGLYERRLENTPRTERELARLTQEHDGLREMLRSLTARRGEAQIAADVEHQRKGETFRIIESAATPALPTGPNRMRLVILGLLLGAGASALAVVVAEQFDSSYRSPDEVRATLAVPLVSAIPTIRTDRDRQRDLRRRVFATVAAAASLLVVIGAAAGFARQNTALVSLLTPAPMPTSTR
jgi:succinoglycan biosynthesis transport protein ExoP